MTRRWYVISTEPGVEHLAAQELSRDNFEVFAPRIQNTKNRVGQEDSAFFPGYLFLQLDHGEADGGSWPTFRSAHRVRGFVRFGSYVPSLSDEAIRAVSDRVKMINGEDGLWQRFRTGETVQVVSGALEGIGLIVEEAKSPQARAKVLLEFMGRMVQADVPWRNIRPTESELARSVSLGARGAPRRTRGKGRWIQGYGTRIPATAKIVR